MRSYTIQENDSGQRLDKFLQKAVPKLPKALLYKYLRKKRIKVNKKRAEPNRFLAAGDVVELYINDEFFPQEEEPTFLSVPARITVIYEDQNILLVDKPQGLVVHEDDSQTDDTLIARIQHYLFQRGEYDPRKEHSFAPALVNRIDRNTCGIVIAAKNAAALRILSEKIRNREVQKQYLCLTAGRPVHNKETLIHYHLKDPRQKLVTVSDKPGPEFKTMITAYRVLDSRNDLSLVEVDLKTGRTHQIRAHMAHIGCPILGDGKYGSGKANRKYKMRYQTLCSYSLTFCFQSDAGILEYLNNQTFKVPSVWFRDQFYDGSLFDRAAERNSNQ